MSEKVLNLLSDNPNSWSIEGDKIVFSDDNILNEYNDYIKTLENIVSKEVTTINY